MYIGRYARTYLQPHYRPFGKKLFLHTSWDSWWMEGTPIMFCIGSLDYKITIYQVTAPTSKTMQSSEICTKYRQHWKSDFSNVWADRVVFGSTELFWTFLHFFESILLLRVFFHVLMGKKCTKLEFLQIVETALKSWLK